MMNAWTQWMRAVDSATLGLAFVAVIVALGALWRWRQRRQSPAGADALPYDSAMDSVTLPPRSRM